MNYQITIRRLLATFMIAGLVLAPLSRPVMAGPSSDASTAAMGNDISMSAMADEMTNDMPCCPSKAPMPVGCDKCVFMATCAAKCFSGLTMALFQPIFAVSAGHAYPQNDFWPDGLGHPPPEYPPSNSGLIGAEAPVCCCVAKAARKCMPPCGGPQKIEDLK